MMLLEKTGDIIGYGEEKIEETEYKIICTSDYDTSECLIKISVHP